MSLIAQLLELFFDIKGKKDRNKNKKFINPFTVLLIVLLLVVFVFRIIRITAQ